MKTSLLKISNVTIAGLLAVLGFVFCLGTSCAKNGTPEEDGTSSANFIVYGTVLSEETEQPIENISVTMEEWITAFSDDEGKYEVTGEGLPQDQSFLVQFHDMDDKYEDLDTLIEFMAPLFTGGDGKLYAGETRKDVDVFLIPKNRKIKIKNLNP